jgi:L-iditol 2-dehydrogenase
MKVPVIAGERDAEIRDVPEPDPVGDWVKVRIDVAPMCTEYKSYLNGDERTDLGHEGAGEVVDVAQPCDVAVGDRVVVMPLYACGTCDHCRAGEYIHCEDVPEFEAVAGTPHGNATYGQYVLKPDWLCVPIPEGVSTEHASMACCGLGPTFGACERLGVDALDTLLISGGGPVGLGGVINGAHRGARVIVVEPEPYRADLARELGADAVVDPGDGEAAERLAALTDGEGVDKAIECTGVPAAQRFAVDAVKRRGAMAFVGEGDEFELHVSDDMLRKGLTLRGSWHYNRALASDLLSVIEANPDRIDALLTHEFPLSEIEDAFERQSERRTGKVLLRPWD